MENITHPELVRALVKPGSLIRLELTAEEAHLWHMATGICGEAAELVEAIDELLFNEPDFENLVEELGDLEFYLEGVRQAFTWERDSVLAVNLTPPTRFLSSDAYLFQLVSGINRAGGEIMDAIKKIVIYRKRPDFERIIHAMALMEYWLERFRIHFGILREQCLAANIAKLKKRYSELKYTDAQAIARKDKN